MCISNPHLLGIHEKVDDGIEGRVGHGQPEEGEEDVLRVGLGGDVHVVVVDEVGVVGQPADTEHDQHHNEHDAHLLNYRLIQVVSIFNINWFILQGVAIKCFHEV